MTPFSSFALFASIVAGVITVSFGTHYPSVYYAYNRYTQSIQVNGDIRIKLTSNLYLNPNMNCSISFYPRSGKQLKAKFLTYTMYLGHTSESGNCPYESIQLYNALGASQLPTSTGRFCSQWKPYSNFYLGSVGQFRLQTGTYLVNSPADVDLLISEGVNYSSNSSCPYNYFDCGNSYCVPEDVTCNGYDDCGNSSDEIEGCGLSPATIGGIVAAVFFFIVLSILFAVLFYRNRQRRYYQAY